MLVAVQRLVTPWRRVAERPMTLDPQLPLAVLGLFGDAIDFIFNQQEAQTCGGQKVGGPRAGRSSWPASSSR